MIIKTIFLGTNEFGAGILEALLGAKDVALDLIITQTDKPSGRNQQLKLSPVKILAQAHNLKIEQPKDKQSLKDIFENLKEKPDLIVVCDYGMIIPKTVLESSKLGSINVHPSLLPKYRGASPIQSALINGDKETGVSIMFMDEKLDHGAIILQEKINIENTDNYSSLAQKLLPLAKILIVEGIKKVFSNPSFKGEAQDDSQAVICREFTRADGQIDWNKSAQEIFNLWRGLGDWPGVWTMLGDKRVKIISIEIDEDRSNLALGEIAVENKEIFWGTKKGIIKIKELQLEGKKIMTAAEFLNGYKKLLV